MTERSERNKMNGVLLRSAGWGWLGRPEKLVSSGPRIGRPPKLGKSRVDNFRTVHSPEKTAPGAGNWVYLWGIRGVILPQRNRGKRHRKNRPVLRPSGFLPSMDAPGGRQPPKGRNGPCTTHNSTSGRQSQAPLLPFSPPAQTKGPEHPTNCVAAQPRYTMGERSGGGSPQAGGLAPPESPQRGRQGRGGGQGRGPDAHSRHGDGTPRSWAGRGTKRGEERTQTARSKGHGRNPRPAQRRQSAGGGPGQQSRRGRGGRADGPGAAEAAGQGHSSPQAAHGPQHEAGRPQRRPPAPGFQKAPPGATTALWRSTNPTRRPPGPGVGQVGEGPGRPGRRQ